MDHIVPQIFPQLLVAEEELLFNTWCEDTPKMIQGKMNGHMEYKADLRRLLRKESLSPESRYSRGEYCLETWVLIFDNVARRGALGL